MTDTKTNSILETIHDYLHAIQTLHKSHGKEYNSAVLHPEIGSAISKLDSYLHSNFDLHAVSPLLKVATEQQKGTHLELRNQVKNQCDHHTVQNFLSNEVEINDKFIKQLFYKYQLNQNWLTEFINERRGDIQVIISYLHELLVVLDMTFHLRGFAHAYGN